MTSMEREPYYKDEITKTREFSSRTTRKLESSKKFNRDGKTSHGKTVQQEKEKSTRTKVGNNLWLEAKNIDLLGSQKILVKKCFS